VPPEALALHAMLEVDAVPAQLTVNAVCAFATPKDTAKAIAVADAAMVRMFIVNRYLK